MLHSVQMSLKLKIHVHYKSIMFINKQYLQRKCLTDRLLTRRHIRLAEFSSNIHACYNASAANDRYAYLFINIFFFVKQWHSSVFEGQTNGSSRKPCFLKVVTQLCWESVIMKKNITIVMLLFYMNFIYRCSSITLFNLSNLQKIKAS